MLSTSFIVARQPDNTSRQKGLSRNSVTNFNFATHGSDTAKDLVNRGRDSIPRQQDNIYESTSPSVNNTKVTSVKKLGRSLSMNKRGDRMKSGGGKVDHQPGRSVSQTRDPQLTKYDVGWDRTNDKNMRKETIRENEEGATKFGYSYNGSLYGTLRGDGRSIYAIQSRPLPETPGAGKKSLYENINRFTSSPQDNTRSKIPVYKPRGDNTLGQRAVTQMEISRTFEDPSRLELSLSDQEDSVVKKGLMWLQQDKLFSRWKERFIILTNGYLQIFKKGVTRFSDMGTFISKVKVSGIASSTLEDKRGYLTLVLTTSFPQEGKLLLRKTEGLKDWHDSVVRCCQRERQKKSNLPTEQFWNRKQLSESCGFDSWISARDIAGGNLEDSPCSSIGRHYRPVNSLLRAKNIYCDNRDYPGTDPSGHSPVSPIATSSLRKAHTLNNHSPVRLHQAILSPPTPEGSLQRKRL